MSFYKLTSEAWRDIQKSVGTKIYNLTLNASETRLIINRRDRHSLYVFNSGANDIQLRKEANGDSLTLKAGERMAFEIHYLAIDADGRYVYHCEWDDDLYIRNTGASTNTVEVFEVL